MINNDFKYCLDYTVDGNYNCENHGCNDEGICRCYQIDSVSINHVSIRKISSQIFENLFNTASDSWKRDSKLFGLIYNVNPLELNYLWDYCISRILVINKVWDKSKWISKWSSGYYGDEVDKVSINSVTFSKIKKDLSEIQSINSLPEMIQYLLKREYGKVLDKIIDKNYTIKEVNSEDIYFPQQSHYQKVISKDLSYLQDSREDDIQGICFEENNKYNVVDGYHRLSYYKNKSKKITIISIC